ncbi:MAG: TIM barrel protein, partial [Candidatus Brocadiaceae bacterium]
MKRVSRTDRPRVSLFSQSLFALPLDEAIEATASAGFPAIELACTKPHLDLERARREADKVAERIEQVGLRVSALSLFNSFTTPDRLANQIDSAETFIRLAPLFKTKILKMTPGPPGSAEATEEHWGRLADALARLVPAARETGVRLAFETHMRQLTDTLASSERLLALAPADAVGLTVDFSNLSFAGEQ